MINIKQINKDYFEMYNSIPMKVQVNSIYELDRIDNGLGGIAFREVKVKPYTKDFHNYSRASEYEGQFDITNWGFFMAFDDERPIGAVTIASRTIGVNIIYGRDDLCVLWDIRVDDAYKHRGVGQALFNEACSWAMKNGLSQMVIECQNNNIPAIRFYHKQGARLSAFNEYAYYGEDNIENEIQLMWYLDIK